VFDSGGEDAYIDEDGDKTMWQPEARQTVAVALVSRIVGALVVMIVAIAFVVFFVVLKMRK
jgi:hypothetical protein